MFKNLSERHSKDMGWMTVYIRGKSGFEEEVAERLNSSDFPFMPGSSYEKGLMLYWIPDQSTLRSFKKVIGSKIVFRYRLHFYTNVEAFIESQHNEDVQSEDVNPPFPAEKEF